jgi:hypothetical protein
MALIEKKEYQSEVLPASQHHQVQVRVSNLIVDSETDEVKATTFHRHVLSPGADISGEAPEVQAVCNAVWTDEVIAAYEAFVAAQEAEMAPPASE